MSNNISVIWSEDGADSDQTIHFDVCIASTAPPGVIRLSYHDTMVFLEWGDLKICVNIWEAIHRGIGRIRIEDYGLFATKCGVRKMVQNLTGMCDFTAYAVMSRL